MIVPERTVTATRAEFLHGVQLAFPGAVREHEGVLRVRHGESEMEIHLDPGPPLSLGLLRLSTLKVRITFTAGSREAQRTQLERMDLAMQRGGG